METITTVLRSEKRGALRQRCCVETLLLEDNSERRFTARVKDISRRGMRLEMTQFIPCGDEVLIYPPDGFGLRPVRAMIVRQAVQETETGTRFECGMRFLDTAELRRHTWFLSLRMNLEG